MPLPISDKTALTNVTQINTSSNAAKVSLEEKQRVQKETRFILGCSSLAFVVGLSSTLYFVLKRTPPGARRRLFEPADDAPSNIWRQRWTGSPMRTALSALGLGTLLAATASTAVIYAARTLLDIDSIETLAARIRSTSEAIGRTSDSVGSDVAKEGAEHQSQRRWRDWMSEKMTFFRPKQNQQHEDRELTDLEFEKALESLWAPSTDTITRKDEH